MKTLTNYEFEVGDRIVRIGEKFTYDILRYYDGSYEMMENGGLGYCYRYKKDYVEKCFILVSTFKERANGEE